MWQTKYKTCSRVNIVSAAEINTDSKKAPEQIRIKTLEEIRKEKAAKSLSKQSPSGSESDEVKPVKDLRKLIVMMNPIGKTKSMCDAPASAAKKELEEVPKQPTAKLLAKKAVQSEPSPPATAPHLGGVQVKTLEEIRREKAARIEAQRGKEAEPSKDGDGESCSGKNSHLLLVKKAASPSKNPVHTDVLHRPVVLIWVSGLTFVSLHKFAIQFNLKKNQQQQQNTSPIFTML